MNKILSNVYLAILILLSVLQLKLVHASNLKTHSISNPNQDYQCCRILE